MANLLASDVGAWWACLVKLSPVTAPALADAVCVDVDAVRYWLSDLEAGGFVVRLEPLTPDREWRWLWIEAPSGVPVEQPAGLFDGL